MQHIQLSSHIHAHDLFATHQQSSSSHYDLQAAWTRQLPVPVTSLQSAHISCICTYVSDFTLNPPMWAARNTPNFTLYQLRRTRFNLAVSKNQLLLRITVNIYMYIYVARPAQKSWNQLHLLHCLRTFDPELTNPTPTWVMYPMA